MRHALHAFIREPVAHFLLLGALLYAMSVLHARLNDPRRIVITTADVARLEQRYLQQFGVRPSSSQVEWLIARHVRDEVLYREGLALGLGEGDEVVRRRVVQKMEFLSEGDGLIPEPTIAELHSFYDAHAARYRTPARVSFTHLYFSPDSQGEAVAREHAASVLRQLRARPGEQTPAVADSFWDRQQFERVDQTEVERIFGRSELSRKVIDLPAGSWSEPLRSGYGWHLVRVAAREVPRPAIFAEIQTELRADWQEEQRAEHKRESLEQLMRQYRIVREIGGQAEKVVQTAFLPGPGK